MAQAVASSPMGVAFPTPPGLEAVASTPTKGAAFPSPPGLEDKLNQTGANVNRQAIIEAIREVVLHDVDLKVAEKIEERWQKGKQMLSQIQQKHEEKTNKLTEEVTKCHEKLRGLEKENESLKQAFVTQNPQRTPLSVVNAFTPPTASPEVAKTPVSGAGCFSFTLRKADGAELGLNVSHHDQDRVLRVEGVRPDGAIEAWNRQCAADKIVLSGDKIIGVNNIAYDPEKMFEECRDKQLLKLTIVRGDLALPTMSAKASPPNKTTILRADASVFVPNSPPEEDGTTEQEGLKAVAEETTDVSMLQNVDGTAERV